MLVSALEKAVQKIQFNEKGEQADHKKIIEDSAANRASDSKSLTNTEVAKAALKQDFPGFLSKLFRASLRGRAPNKNKTGVRFNRM